jgi:hypothetical protein
MKALIAMLILVSSFANADCDLIEDPPISEVNCNLDSVYLPTGSEWTRLFYNPKTMGLNDTGVMSAAVSVVVNGSDVLIGKVEASEPILDSASVSASTDTSAWVDVVLHHSSAGENSIELLAYRYVEGKLMLEDSVSTTTLSTSATAAFNIDYSYASNSGVTVNIRAAANNEIVGSLSVAQFGQTLPSMRLRRGTQPAASGVLSAGFTPGALE